MTKMVLPKQVSLNGHAVRLRPILHEDYRQLFEWRSDAGSLYLWSHPRRLVSFREYVAYLEQSLAGFIDTYLLITGLQDNEPLGFVYNYDTNSHDGYTFLATYVAAQSRARGIGKEANILFLDYLFGYFPYRKIYMDIFEFNIPSVAFARSYAMAQEGFFLNIAGLAVSTGGYSALPFIESDGEKQGSERLTVSGQSLLSTAQRLRRSECRPVNSTHDSQRLRSAGAN